jgi:hypothetical protein
VRTERQHCERQQRYATGARHAAIIASRDIAGTESPLTP